MKEECLIKIAKIIAEVESNSFQYAIRFEPHIYIFLKNRKNPQILKKIVELNKCSYETAKMIYSSSWGMYQIMGFNIYMKGYYKSIGEFLASKDEQYNVLQEFLKQFWIKYNCEALFSAIETVYNQVKNLTGKKRIDNVEIVVKRFQIIKDFVKFYNGAKFPDPRSLDYILRMLYAYQKIKQEVMI